MQEEQRPLLPCNHGGSCGGGGGRHDNNETATNVRRTQLTKFAFLLCSARGEGSDEPVVGMHHDVEMQACFSQQHLHNGGYMCAAGGTAIGVPGVPPSIASHSLLIQGKSGQTMTKSMSRTALMEIAATNMTTPFYTTPDTVSSTAKTVLKNVVTTMEELLDSRLRSTVSQLRNSLGNVASSQMLLRLLNPSRDPVRVATAITRFAVPDEREAEINSTIGSDGCELICIPLQFQAILDVKIFGAVSTVKIVTSVNMAGRFDSRDGLLTAVNVSFDCISLLNTMVAQARSIVKTATTKATSLSMQIAQWHAKKKEKAASVGMLVLERTAASPPREDHAHTAALGGARKHSMMSLHSLQGHSLSHGSQTSLDLRSALSNFFTSFSNSAQIKAHKQQRSASKGLLRSRSLHSRTKCHQSEGYSSPNNANETFDFGPTVNVTGALGGSTAVATNVVRFQMSNGSASALSHLQNNNRVVPNPLASSWSKNEHPQEAPRGPSPPSQPQPPPDTSKGNIHAGLFSWLENDKIFLTDEKIREQNAADAESERIAAAAPQPLRFFTAADGLGQHGLEIVSNEIFGNRLIDQRLQEKKRQHRNQCVGDAKRRKPG